MNRLVIDWEGDICFLVEDKEKEVCAIYRLHEYEEFFAIRLSDFADNKKNFNELDGYLEGLGL